MKMENIITFYKHQSSINYEYVYVKIENWKSQYYKDKGFGCVLFDHKLKIQ